jgi:hypothetical protein
MNICFNRRGVVPLVAPRRPLAVVDGSLGSFSKTRSIHPSVRLSIKVVSRVNYARHGLFLPSLAWLVYACMHGRTVDPESQSIQHGLAPSPRLQVITILYAPQRNGMGTVS